MVVWLVLGREPADKAMPVVGVEMLDDSVDGAMTLITSFEWALDGGGVEGGGVDSAEDETEGLGDLDCSCRGRRGMGSLACVLFISNRLLEP